MKKLIPLIVLALLSFAGTMAALIAVTGEFENVKKLVRGEPVTEPAAEEGPDALEQWTGELRERETALAEEEARLQEEEERQQRRLEEMEDILKRMEEIQGQVQGAVATSDAEQQTRMKEVADSYAAMSPEKAAEALKEWPTEEAAGILRLIKERDRGKILDKLEPSEAGRILRALKEKDY